MRSMKGMMSSEGMRVANSDWCPSRKVVSVNLMGFFPAIDYSLAYRACRARRLMAATGRPINVFGFRFVGRGRGLSALPLSQTAALHQEPELHGRRTPGHSPEVQGRARGWGRAGRHAAQ